MKKAALAAVMLALILLAPSLNAEHRPRHTATPSPTPTPTTTPPSTTPTTPPTTPTTPPTTPTTSTTSTPPTTTAPSTSKAPTTPPKTTTSAPPSTPTKPTPTTARTTSETPGRPLDLPLEPLPDSPFGHVDIEPYPHVGPEPYPMNVTVTLKPLHLGKLHYLIVLVPDHSSSLLVELGEPRRLDGTPIPIFEDDRANGSTKYILNGSHVIEAGGSFVVPLVVKTASNGRFHFGVYVAGFDAAWEEFTVAPGHTAETFGRAAVSGFGHSRGLFDPPFRGDGNAIPSPSTAFVAVAVVGAICLLRRRSRDLVDEDTP